MSVLVASRMQPFWMMKSVNYLPCVIQTRTRKYWLTRQNDYIIDTPVVTFSCFPFSRMCIEIFLLFSVEFSCVWSDNRLSRFIYFLLLLPVLLLHGFLFSSADLVSNMLSIRSCDLKQRLSQEICSAKQSSLLKRWRSLKSVTVVVPLVGPHVDEAVDLYVQRIRMGMARKPGTHVSDVTSG